MAEPPTLTGVDGLVALLSEPDALDGEDVLPGFDCPLTELW